MNNTEGSFGSNIISRFSGAFHLETGLAFLFHGGIADQHRPHIGAGFGNHQHTDHRKGISPQHHRNIETKAQHDGQPHPAEGLVAVFLGAAIVTVVLLFI